MPGGARSKDQREADRARVASLHLQGLTVAEIAAKVGMSERTTYKDLKEIKRRWFATTIENRDEWVKRELASIEQREKKLWEQWERSCENMKMRRKKSGKTNSDGILLPNEYTTVVKGQVGSARIMAEIRKCSEQRCKILGLYAPTQIEASVTHRDMTDEELAEHAQRLGLMSPRLVERMKQNQEN